MGSEMCIRDRRAYARVRAGEQVALAARPVTVSRFDVHAVRTVHLDATMSLDPTVPLDTTVALDVDVTVVCSSGTYVRALARDLGDALGVGGHLTVLRRTRVGGYGLAVARTLDELAELADDVPLDVLSLADAARATFPVRDLTPDEARDLSYGKHIDAGPPGSEPVAAIAPDGTLIALLATSGSHARPVLVFAPA